MLDAVQHGVHFLETSLLRQIAGLGVNVTEVYPLGRCYLKGFFNAMEAWREGRDPDSWRVAQCMEVVGDLAA